MAKLQDLENSYVLNPNLESASDLAVLYLQMSLSLDEVLARGVIDEKVLKT